MVGLARLEELTTRSGRESARRTQVLNLTRDAWSSRRKWNRDVSERVSWFRRASGIERSEENPVEEPSGRDPLGIENDPASLFGVLAHELRTPLAAIRSAAQLLHLASEHPGTREFVEGLLDRQSRHMSQMIDDLMELALTRKGKFPFHRRTVNLADVIESSLDAVRPLIMERAHQLEVALPHAPVSFSADPERLRQIVTNLLTNAVKYTPCGGRIWLTAEQHDGQVVLRIRDSGIGIDPEMLPRVFDPFWRESRACNDGKGGLGIGLALVRHFVELHGGTVTAMSEGEGRGTEFVVRLDQKQEH
jgi:signal transduction histidine kinase